MHWGVKGGSISALLTIKFQQNPNDACYLSMAQVLKELVEKFSKEKQKHQQHRHDEKSLKFFDSS